MQRHLSVLTDVKDVSELLEGARVEQAQLIPQPGKRLQLIVELTRAMLEQQRVVKQGFFRRMKTPFIKSRLTVNGVTAATVRRLEEVPPNGVPLLVGESVPGGYQLTIQAPDGLQLALGVEQLDGLFEDVGPPLETP